MMKAIIYTRVSTGEEEPDGTSLDRQERACLEYAVEQHWEIVRCIRDKGSGDLLEREGLAELRDALRQGTADVVVAHAVDRLSRSQSHLGILYDEVHSAGVALAFVTERFEDTAVGSFILAARAFVAEVGREQTADRSMRGKEARARSGRLPQGSGRGCYGYTYNPDTGRREVEPRQAGVVRRIFGRYAEVRSLSTISSELNDEGIPAFSGGRWYPITVRRLLLNEAYIGRTVYRRTKRVGVGAGQAGRGTRVMERPEEERIEIPGATPAIIGHELWERVQRILEDPERTSRRSPQERHYPLRGRLRCGLCDSAMVGQTLTSKGKSYPYYRCRHAYTKDRSRRCAARYIPADGLEDQVWAELCKVLAAPEVVLRELQRPRGADVHTEERDRLTSEVASLGEASERLRRTCVAVAGCLDSGRQEEFELVLEAIQLSVAATREKVTVEGVVPLEPCKSAQEGFITTEQT